MQTQIINTDSIEEFETQSNELCNNGYVVRAVEIIVKSTTEIRYVGIYFRCQPEDAEAYCSQFGNHRCSLNTLEGKCIAVSCQHQIIKKTF